MKTGAMILAAGMSSRMGDFKPLLKIGSATAIQRIIATLRKAGAEPLVLVTGNRAAEVEAHVAELDVVCVQNEAFATSQMMDSVRIGLRYLDGRCEQTLVTPVDVPLFAEKAARALIAAGDTGAVAAVPVFNGRKGHPLLLSARLFPLIETFSGEGGIAGAIHTAGYTMDRIEVDDEGILMGMNTQDEYRRLLDWYFIGEGDRSK